MSYLLIEKTAKLSEDKKRKAAKGAVIGAGTLAALGSIYGGTKYIKNIPHKPLSEKKLQDLKAAYKNHQTNKQEILPIYNADFRNA